MGRIGKTYPRFEERRESAAERSPEQAPGAFHVAGALVGILAALAFIGWVLTR
jgi:hypothetical protein